MKTSRTFGPLFSWIAQPGQYAEGDWKDYEGVVAQLSKTKVLPPERMDVFEMFRARPGLIPIVAEAIEHIEGGRWYQAPHLADLLLKGGDPDAARRVLACHDPTCGWWRIYPDVTKEPKYYAERCWLRVCPRCAKLAANRLRTRYESRIPKVMSQAVPGWTLKHLTLTMRRSPDLAADLAALHKMAKKIFHHFWGNDKRAGAFGAMEIGPQGGNVHAHLAIWGRFVLQSEISTYWEKLSRKYRTFNAGRLEGDGDTYVDIRRIDPGSAVREVIKYIAKFAKEDDDAADSGLPVEDLAAVHFALKGKRRSWSWGSFYNVDDEPETEKLEPVEAAIDEAEDPQLDRRPVVVSHVELVAALRVLQFTVEINYQKPQGHSALPVDTGPPRWMT